MPSFHSKALDDLIGVIARMEDPQDLRLFFDDLCTIKELQDMAQRFQTARLLDAGKNYQEVSSLIGTSATTISRVSKCLNYGDGGYRKAMALLPTEVSEDGN